MKTETTKTTNDQRGQVLCTTTSLHDARKTRRELSKFHAPGTLRIMQHSWLATIPGRGLRSNVEYTVEVRP